MYWPGMISGSNFAFPVGTDGCGRFRPGLAWAWQKKGWITRMRRKEKKKQVYTG
jgi:hypothetical protein